MSYINFISLYLSVLIIPQNYGAGREADFPPFNLTVSIPNYDVILRLIPK